MALLPPSDLISLCGEEAFCLCWLAVVLSGLAMVILLMARLLTHILQVPSFFGVKRAGTAQGLEPSP